VKVKERHLKDRQKITLSVPKKYLDLVLEAAELGEESGKSLSVIVWEALEEYLNRQKSITADTAVDSILKNARILAEERKTKWRKSTNLKLSKEVMEMVRREALDKGVALEREEEAAIGD
jgi:predicted HicB family RNase H-like nuclease